MSLQSSGGSGLASLKLRLSAYAAIMVALFLTLSAAVQVVRGTNLWIHSRVDPETSVFADAPFEMEYFEQERRRSVRTSIQTVAVGVLLAICGLACSFCAWQLRTAALGRRPVEESLSGQTICWYLAAVLTVLYLISHLWVF